MTQQTATAYDFIKPVSRPDIKADQRDYKERSENKTTNNNKSDSEQTEAPKETKSENRFSQYISNINTTIKDVLASALPGIHHDAILPSDDSLIGFIDLSSFGDVLTNTENSILSDLTNLDFSVLQSGEVLTLPNEINVSLDNNNIVQFSFDGEVIDTPPLTLDQFEIALQELTNLNPESDNLILSGFNYDLEEFAPPVTALKQTLSALQSTINPNLNSQITAPSILPSLNLADKALNLPNQITDNITRNLDLSVRDSKTPILSLSASPQRKDVSFSLGLNSRSTQGIGAQGLQNINAQNASAFNQSLSNISQESTIINAPLLSSTTSGDEGASEESITQFLNNNNLRVVRDGHLQSTQPLSTNQVHVVLSKMANGSQFKRLSVRLDPPELGRIDIQLRSNTNDNTLRAHILVERPEALGMLRKDVHQLEKMLQQSGLSLDENSISFDLSSGGDKESQTQEALKDLWRERNENKLASNLHNESQGDDLIITDSYDEFYQTDDALNIKV